MYENYYSKDKYMALSENQIYEELAKPNKQDLILNIKPATLYWHSLAEETKIDTLKNLANAIAKTSRRIISFRLNHYIPFEFGAAQILQEIFTSPALQFLKTLDFTSHGDENEHFNVEIAETLFNNLTFSELQELNLSNLYPDDEASVVVIANFIKRCPKL